MVLQWSIFAALPLVAAVIAAALVVVAWRHRHRATGVPFALLMAAIAGWSLAAALEVTASARLPKLVAAHAGAMVGGTIPVIWLVLTLRYAERDDVLTRPRLVALAAEPLVFAALLATNPLHGFVWSAVAVAPTPPSAVVFTPAVGYWVHLVFAYLLILVGIGLVASVFLDSSRVHRRQAGLLVVGAVVPLGANALVTFGPAPVPGLDLTPSTFTVTGVVYALALFRYDLLDYTPVAYRNVTDVLGDGVVVLDGDGNVREYNENAETILGTSLTVGEPLTEELPGAADGGAADGVVEATVDGTRRFYDVRSTPLPGPGDPAGTVLALRDVTPLREYEQRLEVTNRVLRHNLRNEVNVIMGQAEFLMDQDEPDEAVLEAIVEKAAELSEVGTKARQIQATMHRRESDLVDVDVVEVAEAVVETARETAPAATVTLDAPAAAMVEAPGEDLLTTALENLVENSIDHHDRDSPTVAVAVETGGDDVRVMVRDDGPGVPSVELEALRHREQTQLDHGSGVGLWLVHWIVTALGGEFEVENRDTRGTVVTLHLPAAD